MRFFLIYGPYRQKLNFTFKKLAETSLKLDSLKTMVADLQEAKPSSQAETQETLTSNIVSDFEKHMNNDLDVKSVFDNLYKTTSELHETRQSLGADDLKNALNGLRGVDSVLQCIF